MRTQTYHRTTFLTESNIENNKVPLQVNCCGAVLENAPFVTHHTRKDYYYLYVLQGSLCVKEQQVNAGEVYLFSPDLPYRYENKGGLLYLWVHFTGFEARKLSEEVFGGLDRKISIGDREDIRKLFEKLFREFMIRDGQFETLSASILRQILALTARYSEDAEMPLKSMSYIHRHFAENITMEKLSDMENMCLTAFRTVFKKHTGVSPNAYLIDLRIQNACRLLKDTSESVADIAAKVGYADPYYFSRIFSKKTGVSPLKFRTQKDFNKTSQSV